jgi:hypothetical protein
MSSVILTGDTSGTLTVSAPLVAGSNTLTLPAATGTLQTLGVGTAVASTSGTSIDFTSIPSWVKRITVMFRGVSLSGSSAILLQLGDSGGIETTGYVSSGTGFSGTGGATISSTSGLVVFSNSSTYIVSGVATITNISSNIWVYGVVGKIDPAVSLAGGGDKELSATLDRIRITTVNGTDTFDAGSINIMYEG